MAFVSATDERPKAKQPRKRSRLGCSNCKLRSVKCDEGKPGCRRCITYGVVCSYNRVDSSQLQSSVEVARPFHLPTELAFWPTKQDELVGKFQMRTAETVSAGRVTELFREQVGSRLVIKPYLYNTVAALTMLHDCHLDRIPPAALTSPVAKSWYEAVTGFAQTLRRPINSDEGKAVWATQMLQGQLVFCHIEATTPEEAWPLADASTSVLDWMRMGDGRGGVLKAIRASEANKDFVPPTPLPPPEVARLWRQDRTSDLPAEFYILFQVNATSTPENNPYHSAAVGLAQIWNPTCYFLLKAFGFFKLNQNMSPDFRRLLEAKDPRALLLLAYWYSQTCDLGIWWLARRSLLEGLAICAYLEEKCPSHDMLLRLVEVPKLRLLAPHPSMPNKKLPHH